MATAKQLAALKKARAARKKNLAAKKSPAKRKAPARKKSTRARTRTRKSNPVVSHSEYLVEITTRDKQKGYLYDWIKFDTVPDKGMNLSRSAAYVIAKALKSQKLPNVGKISVVKK